MHHPQRNHRARRWPVLLGTAAAALVLSACSSLIQPIEISNPLGLDNTSLPGTTLSQIEARYATPAVQQAPSPGGGLYVEFVTAFPSSGLQLNAEELGELITRAADQASPPSEMESTLFGMTEAEKQKFLAMLALVSENKLNQAQQQLGNNIQKLQEAMWKMRERLEALASDGGGSPEDRPQDVARETEGMLPGTAWNLDFSGIALALENVPGFLQGLAKGMVSGFSHDVHVDSFTVESESGALPAEIHIAGLSYELLLFADGALHTEFAETVYFDDTVAYLSNGATYTPQSAPAGFRIDLSGNDVRPLVDLMERGNESNPRLVTSFSFLIVGDGIPVDSRLEFTMAAPTGTLRF